MPSLANEHSEAAHGFLQQTDEISAAYQARIAAWRANVHALATHFNACYHHAHAAAASDGNAFADALSREGYRTQAACDALIQEISALLVEMQERIAALAQLLAPSSEMENNESHVE